VRLVAEWQKALQVLSNVLAAVRKIAEKRDKVHILQRRSEKCQSVLGSKLH